jgi:hypothetical protein
MNTVFTTEELNQYNQTVKSLHDNLTDEEFIKYLEEGKKLSFEQAAELALSTDK